MGRPAKFKEGIKVRSLLNSDEDYIVVKVLKNELVVKETNSDQCYQCKKSLFEAIENE